MIYVVLGMHKSGTTLVAQMLHQSGINMGWDLEESDIHYAQKKCESPAVNRINYDLLDCHGLESLSMPADRQPVITRPIEEKMKAFILRQQQNYADWGFKDPRTVLTYSVWEDLLPDDHKLILVFRHPVEVAGHYLKGKNTLKRQRFGYVRYRSYKIWVTYNERILAIAGRKDPGRHMLIDYNNLMENGNEIDRLSEFTGKKIHDMRKPDLYIARKDHQSHSLFDLWPEWLVDTDSTYNRLKAAVRK